MAILRNKWRRRAVNKQQYGCTSTEDLRLSARVSEQEVCQLVIEFRQWRRRQICIVTIFSNSSAELIFGLD